MSEYHTTFHIGERVRIKKPLTYCVNGLNDEMRSMAGDIVVIDATWGDDNYHIREDDGDWTWCVNCFESLVKEQDDISLEGLL